jgi:DNA-binding PadR family transcriptional regulator
VIIVKFDHDLARRALLTIEASTEPIGLEAPAQYDLAKVEHVSNEQLAYVLLKLNEAGFITGKPIFDGADKFYTFFPVQLTYEGHEYLDKVRSPKVWRETKSIAAKVGSVSLSLMAQIASTVITNTLYPK